MAPLLLQQPLFAAPTLGARRRSATARPSAMPRVRASLADFGDLADPTQRPSKVEAAYRRLRGDRPTAAPRKALPQSPSRPDEGSPERGAAAAETARAADSDRLAPGIALLLLLWAVGGSALDTKLSQRILDDMATDEADVVTLDGDSTSSFAALRAPPPAASSTAAACDPIDGASSAFDDDDGLDLVEEEQDTLPLFLGALTAPLLVLAARGELKTDLPSSLSALSALVGAPAAADPMEAPLTMRAPRVTPRAPRRPPATGAAARSAAAEARLQAQREETSRMVKAKLAARKGVGAPEAGASDDALRRWWNTWWRDNMRSQ